MKINQLTYYNKKTLFKKLRQINLYQQDDQFPYQDATFKLKPIFVKDIAVAQYYVLGAGLDRIWDLHRALDKYHIDLFKLNGFLRLNTSEFGIFDVLPPIVEISEADGGIPLLCDGLHRLYAASACDGHFYVNTVVVENVKLPYYALPNKNGWEDIKYCIDDPPKIRKNYRIKNYKSLFRDFNSQFINVTKVRKHKD